MDGPYTATGHGCNPDERRAPDRPEMRASTARIWRRPGRNRSCGPRDSAGAKVQFVRAYAGQGAPSGVFLRSAGAAWDPRIIGGALLTRGGRRLMSDQPPEP